MQDAGMDQLFGRLSSWEEPNVVPPEDGLFDLSYKYISNLDFMQDIYDCNSITNVQVQEPLLRPNNNKLRRNQTMWSSSAPTYAEPNWSYLNNSCPVPDYPEGVSQMDLHNGFVVSQMPDRPNVNYSPLHRCTSNVIDITSGMTADVRNNFPKPRMQDLTPGSPLKRCTSNTVEIATNGALKARTTNGFISQPMQDLPKPKFSSLNRCTSNTVDILSSANINGMAQDVRKSFVASPLPEMQKVCSPSLNRCTSSTIDILNGSGSPQELNDTAPWKQRTQFTIQPISGSSGDEGSTTPSGKGEDTTVCDADIYAAIKPFVLTLGECNLETITRFGGGRDLEDRLEYQLNEYLGGTKQANTSGKRYKDGDKDRLEKTVAIQNRIDELLVILIFNSGDLLTMMTNVRRSRLFQKLLPHLSPQLANRVATSVTSLASCLMKDQVGSYSITAIIQWCPQSCMDIYQEILQNLVDVSCHKRGCCALQKFLDSIPLNIRMQFVQVFVANSLLLSEDPYGNYAIQYLMANAYCKGIPTMLYNVLKDELASLVCNKYGSCVLEKILVNGDRHVRRRICDFLTRNKEAGVRRHVANSFANYVLQKALDVASDQEHLFIMLKGIIAVLQAKRKLSGGRVLAQKLTLKYAILGKSDVTSKQLRAYCSKLSSLRSNSSDDDIARGVYMSELVETA